MYAGFGSKAKLLVAAKDVAKFPDAEQMPVMQRPELDALDHGTRDDRIQASARLIAETNERTREIDAVWREAAASDPALATVLSEREYGRRQDLADGLARVVGHPVDHDTVDMVWAITSAEVWAKLRTYREWDLPRYQRWIATMLSMLLRED